MSRAHKNISRSLEERSILESADHASQMSQNDNELRQKLEAINTSYKLSNKRIRQETRELKKILRDLQKELKVSKGTHGQYIPSLLEQPQGRVRRTTVSSVPLEDRKEAALERDQQGRVKKGLNHDFTRRRRSGSFPPSSYVDLKKSPQLYSSEPGQHDKNHTTQPNNVEQVSSCRQPKSEGNAAGSASQVRASKRELPMKRPPNEQQQGEKKYLATKVSQPFSKAVCGKFATKEEVIISCSSRSLYQSPPTQQLLEGSRDTGSQWQTPSIVDEYSIKSNQNEQRKKRLNRFHHSLQRKGSIGSNPGETPTTALHGQFDIHDPKYAFDSLPEIVGGRRLSVTHDRVRKTSRKKGLPPLREEKTKPTSERTSAEMWGDLDNCRYLRKEEKEISMHDIFGKD